jgi:hypothetical protein
MTFWPEDLSYIAKALETIDKRITADVTEDATVRFSGSTLTIKAATGDAPSEDIVIKITTNGGADDAVHTLLRLLGIPRSEEEGGMK